MNFKGMHTFFYSVCLVIIFCNTPGIVSGSETITLAGNVINSETGFPISGVLVAVEDIEHVEITDPDGVFVKPLEHLITGLDNKRTRQL